MKNNYAELLLGYLCLLVLEWGAETSFPIFGDLDA